VPLRGEALSSKAPLWALALPQGGHCLWVGQPASPPTVYARWALWQAQGASAPGAQRRRQGRVTAVARARFLQDVLLHDGKQARAVQGGEMPVGHAQTGAHLSDHPLLPQHRLRAENVAQVAHAGRGRGQSDNAHNHGLQPQGSHRAHHFGHGQQSLSARRLSLTLLAFLVPTVLAGSEEPYAWLRQVLARRQTFCEDRRALTRSMALESWPHRLDCLMKGLKLAATLASTLAFQLRPKLDTS